MKKNWKKICGVFTLSAIVTASTTTYAAGTSMVIQPAEGEEELILETEKQSEEESSIKEGIESHILIREQNETEIISREVTKEQLEEEIRNGIEPELAAVVFQLTEEKKSELGLNEIQITDMPEAGFYEETWKTEQVESTEEETENIENSGKNENSVQNVHVIALDELQKELVYEIADMVPQTVVLSNQCFVEDEFVFKDCEAVKAVRKIDAANEEDMLVQVRDFNLEQEYSDYLELMALAENARLRRTSQTESSENKAPKTGSGTLSGSSSGNTGNTNSTDNTESTNSTGDTNSTGSSQTTAVQKDVTITLVPDELLEEDDWLSATYDVVTNTEVTSGKVTITYDKTVMTYSEADASDAMDGMMTSIRTPGDGSVEEGKIEFEFSSTTPKKLNGSMLDLYFDLVNAAEVGKEFTLTLTVNEMKNGSKTLTSEVKTEKMIVLADTDDEEDEETQATAAPQTETLSTQPAATPAPAPTNAPKTGDETNVVVFILAILCSAVVFGKAGKRA